MPISHQRHMQEAEDRLTNSVPHDTALGHDCSYTGLQLTRPERASRVSNGSSTEYTGRRRKLSPECRIQAQNLTSGYCANASRMPLDTQPPWRKCRGSCPMASPWAVIWLQRLSRFHSCRDMACQTPTALGCRNVQAAASGMVGRACSGYSSSRRRLGGWTRRFSAGES